MAACVPIACLTTPLVVPLYAGHFEQGNEAYSSSDYKQAVTHYQRALQAANESEKAEIQARLTLAYYRDQDDVAAFTTYLEALNGLKGKDEVPSDAEEALYQEGLLDYFAQQHGAAKAEAVSLREKYLSVIEAHPEYHKLPFLVAAANANLGLFDQFFEEFFTSSKAYPNHWLSHKIRALIHIKLMERLSDPDARAEQLQLARERLEMALETGRTFGEVDTSLYKMLIASSPADEKSKQLEKHIASIVDGDTPIPRRDIAYYVQESVKADNPDLAEKLLNRVRQWYDYSRSLDVAERLLERYREQHNEMG